MIRWNGSLNPRQPRPVEPQLATRDLSRLGSGERNSTKGEGPRGPSERARASQPGQFSVTAALYTCRPDLVGFVNGLPLVVIKLKKPGVPARAAFDENLTHYKQQIPALFWLNALLIASNGTDSRVGSLTADWERSFEHSYESDPEQSAGSGRESCFSPVV
jgi:hypothetical protein